MIRHSEISNEELRQKIKQKKICLGGNIKLKIYGKLNCKSGKRMKRENRVFFHSETEAIELGFRSCRRCLKMKNGTSHFD